MYEYFYFLPLYYVIFLRLLFIAILLSFASCDKEISPFAEQIKESCTANYANSGYI